MRKLPDQKSDILSTILAGTYLFTFPKCKQVAVCLNKIVAFGLSGQHIKVIIGE